MTIDLELPSTSAAPARARGALDGIASDVGPDRLRDVRLLVSELVTNAVRHGNGREPVEVHAHWNADIRVEVVDHGHGFSPQPRFGARDEPGGFGLYLVGRLADQWGVETTDGTTVWFVLERH